MVAEAVLLGLATLTMKLWVAAESGAATIDNNSRARLRPSVRVTSAPDFGCRSVPSGRVVKNRDIPVHRVRALPRGRLDSRKKGAYVCLDPKPIAIGTPFNSRTATKESCTGA